MEWKGTEMEKFLTPDTLFSNKFEKYLNQNIKKGARKPADMKVDTMLKPDKYADLYRN